jgi:ubiquinone/menaquinone biosynthesis C-methylase UbiE
MHLALDSAHGGEALWVISTRPRDTMSTPTSSPAPSIDQIKASMRATWMAGDFGVVAKTITTAAVEFVERMSITSGNSALDVACGTGNVALPMARQGAVVTGVDIAPNLLDQARARAAAENLSIQFDEGDAEQMPYADGSFDVVATMFGAMFAPRPEIVASELARVLKPGGLLAMANWNPPGFTGKMFKVGSGHVPPPPGVPPPVLWGDDSTVRARLEPYFADIKTEIIPIDFDMPVSPAGAVAFFRKYFGPTQVAFSRLDEAGQAALAADLEKLWSAANVAPDPAEHTLVRNEYLQVMATRK